MTVGDAPELGELTVAVALKWVDHRPEVDPLTACVRTDDRTSRASAADRAALEWGLRAAEAWGARVVAVTAGPAPAEAVLREAVAAGAGRAVRVDLDPGAPSEDVAAGLAPVVEGAALVLCGSWSLDRGSGSVPAYLAAHLGAAQALGCSHLALDQEAPGRVRAERRLDGGRRELLVLRAPGVVSVEGRTAALRRASLGGVLRGRQAQIEVVTPDGPRRQAPPPTRTGPFRPRPRWLSPPSAELGARQRIAALTGVLGERSPPQLLLLDPPAAAARLLEQLRAWGYLP